MADLTDTEIVAACARAIGVQPHPMWNAAKWPTPDFFGTHGVFNPLTDRAQAMELVEKLEMFIARTNTGFWETYALCSGGKTFSENLLRAICLCAARVQIEKEKNAND